MSRVALLRSLMSLALVGTLGVAPASAGMLGNTLTMTLGQTGTTTITNTMPISAVVGTGPDEFGFCVGTATQACPFGMAGWVDVSDTQLRFDFAAGTAQGVTGSFSVTFTGFSQPVLGVSLASTNLTGNLLYLTATSTANSVTFTGTPSWWSDYYGAGIAYATFTVEQAAADVPEPGSSLLMLVGSALSASRGLRRRSRR